MICNLFFGEEREGSGHLIFFLDIDAQKHFLIFLHYLFVVIFWRFRILLFPKKTRFEDLKDEFLNANGGL
jgi:hypothetical protein